jgi:hypothetical protein
MDVLAWRYPWSGWDPETRLRLGAGACDVSAADANLVEVPVGTVMRPRGRAAEPWADRVRIGTDRGERALWAFPAAIASAETHGVEVVGRGGVVALDLTQRGAVAKPRRGHESSDRALELDGLSALLVDRFERVIEAASAPERVAVTGKIQGLVRPRWEDVVATVLEDPDVDEPAMALIVRHAQDLPRHVVDLAERPRRVLRRERQLQALDRIQELDAQCLTWYVRQPGKTAAQKAGPRQELLAVVRRESIDTLENRVLKDFLVRTTAEAERYTRANRLLAGSKRYGAVRRYGNTIRRLLTAPDLEEVRPLAGVPAPNYVLQHDRRYRRLWRAYLELVRRQEVLDEAWSWQRRLWADAVTIAIASVLDVAPNVRVLHEAPAYLRAEQDHGRWTEGAFPHRWAVVEGGGAPTFVEVRRGGVEGVPADPALGALRPDVVVRATDADGRERGVTVFWALHGTGEADPVGPDALASAHRALERWSATHPGRRVHGVAVVPTWAAATSIMEDGRAGLLAVPLATHGLAEAIVRLEHAAALTWGGPG